MQKRGNFTDFSHVYTCQTDVRLGSWSKTGWLVPLCHWSYTWLRWKAVSWYQCISDIDLKLVLVKLVPLPLVNCLCGSVLKNKTTKKHCFKTYMLFISFMYILSIFGFQFVGKDSGRLDGHTQLQWEVRSSHSYSSCTDLKRLMRHHTGKKPVSWVCGTTFYSPGTQNTRDWNEK